MFSIWFYKLIDPSVSFWYYSFPLNWIQQFLSFSSRKDAATVICRCLGSTIPYHEICLKITIYNWQMINQLSRAMFNSYVINDQRVSHKNRPKKHACRSWWRSCKKPQDQTWWDPRQPSHWFHQQKGGNAPTMWRTMCFEQQNMSILNQQLCGLNMFEPKTHNLLVFWTKKHMFFIRKNSPFWDDQFGWCVRVAP